MTNCPDCKKAALTSVAVFLVFNVLEFLVHGVLLMGAYHQPQYVNVWNPMDVMGARRWAGLVAYAIMALVFTKFYIQGYESERGCVGQGLRFGLLFGLVISAYHALLSFMIYPVSLKLALAWLGAGLAEFAVLGLVAGAIYRPKGAACPPATSA